MLLTKKLLAAGLAAVLVFSLTACGNSDSVGRAESSGTELAPPVALTDDTETTDSSAGSNEKPAASDGNILIAYFTAAENSGVDAVASASYTTVDGQTVGRIRAVADWIAEGTDGELFSIRTETVYPTDGGELIDYADQEQAENARPILTSHIDDLDQYDTIFIGYPNWWYDMPMALYSFFDEYDFSGKTIVPFNVHNGSRFSGTIQTIQELEPDAVVIEDGFTVSERDVADAAGDVADWLADLGY